MKKKLLTLPTEYQELSEVPLNVNANILVHNYPGGIRCERVVPEDVLEGWGFIVDDTSIRNPENGIEYSGITLRDAIDDLAEDFPTARSLSRALGRDAEGECRDYLQSQGYPLNVHQYLYEEVPVEYAEHQLEVSRLYRRLKGKPLDVITKWTQQDADGNPLPYGHGYELNKFPLQVKGDVYLAGTGGVLQQIEAGIKTDGKIRTTDRRKGSEPDYEPSEPNCVGNEATGNGFGMSGVEHFYDTYQHWRDIGKKVWFKARAFCPPSFPCVVLHTTRPHNEETICYTDQDIEEFPDWESIVASISRANVIRNHITKTGEIQWPEYDDEMVERMLCAPLRLRFSPADVIDLERKVHDKARFPITRDEFRVRCMMERPAFVHTGISSSVMIFLLQKQQDVVNQKLRINLMDYDFLAAHQDIEECLWSFEAMALQMGLKRDGQWLVGFYDGASKKAFQNSIEKHLGKC